MTKWQSCELCYVMNFYCTVFPYKSNKLLCTVLISPPWKSCKFEFYTIECFKLIVLLLITKTILNRIFLMECFESIVVFGIDGGSEVGSGSSWDHHMRSIDLLDKLVNLKELNKDERASLSSIKGRLEITRVKNKKPRPIKDFFK